MKTIENFKKEIEKSGLVGKSVKDLLSKNNALYYRIYGYAKRNDIWLTKLFMDLGLILNRVDKIDSIEKLDQFMGEKMFSYKNNEWSKIPTSHKNLIKKTLKSLDISFNAFLERYEMIYVNPKEAKLVYRSINDIKDDLESKQLKGLSISHITSYDGGQTMANIQSFAEKNNFKMKDVWFALNIAYSEKVVMCDTGVKIDFVYHNDDEMIKDFKSKKLIGKTKREVWFYDKGTTVGRITKYAKQSNVDISFLWKMLDVKKSPRRKIELSFSTLDELKVIVEKKGLVGKTIQEVNFLDPDLCSQVKKYARKGVSMSKIWNYVGVVRTQGYYSVEEIVSKIKEGGYKNVREIRENRALYKQITSFTDSRKDVTTTSIWKKAGIAYSSKGRPVKA